MRIIPRNTKVATEFFTGVSLADILVGTVGVLIIFFVVISNLPYKIGICGTIAAIFILLLVRIDTEANYMFFNHGQSVLNDIQSKISIFSWIYNRSCNSISLIFSKIILFV